MSSSSSSRTPSKRKAPVDRSITSSKKNRLSIVGQGSSSAQPTPSRRNRADESDADAASVDHDVEWDWSATRVLATRAHDYTVPTPQRVRHPEDEDASVASSEAPAARPSITASRGRRSSMGSTAVPAVPAAARRSSVGGAVAAQFPLSSEPDREQLAAAATAAAASAAAKAAAEAEAAAAAAAEAAAAAAAAAAASALSASTESGAVEVSIPVWVRSMDVWFLILLVLLPISLGLFYHAGSMVKLVGGAAGGWSPLADLSAAGDGLQRRKDASNLAIGQRMAAQDKDVGDLLQQLAALEQQWAGMTAGATTAAVAEAAALAAAERLLLVAARDMGVVEAQARRVQEQAQQQEQRLLVLRAAEEGAETDGSIVGVSSSVVRAGADLQLLRGSVPVAAEEMGKVLADYSGYSEAGKGGGGVISVEGLREGLVATRAKLNHTETQLSAQLAQLGGDAAAVAESLDSAAARVQRLEASAAAMLAAQAQAAEQSVLTAEQQEANNKDRTARVEGAAVTALQNSTGALRLEVAAQGTSLQAAVVRELGKMEQLRKTEAEAKARAAKTKGKSLRGNGPSPMGSRHGMGEGARRRSGRSGELDHASGPRGGSAMHHRVLSPADGGTTLTSAPVQGRSAGLAAAAAGDERVLVSHLQVAPEQFYALPPAGKVTV
ncbi:hypothetical protein B484DRAFT_478377, partial [Ochromonadaceae sp. CCMP2298]